MPAEVESVAVAHDRAGETADLTVGLEDDDGACTAREHVACRQPRRTATEHGEGFAADSSHLGHSNLGSPNLLTVVIPATDTPATLGRCLAALHRSSEPHEVEVVAGPAGDGPAAARNRGVARTAGEIVVFVDADVEVHPDALRRLREAFDARPRARRRVRRL